MISRKLGWNSFNAGEVGNGEEGREDGRENVAVDVGVPNLRMGGVRDIVVGALGTRNGCQVGKNERWIEDNFEGHHANTTMHHASLCGTTQTNLKILTGVGLLDL